MKKLNNKEFFKERLEELFVPGLILAGYYLLSLAINYILV